MLNGMLAGGMLAGGMLAGGMLAACSGPQPPQPEVAAPAPEKSFAQQLSQARRALDSGDLRSAQVWLLAQVQRVREEPQVLPDYLQLCDDVAHAHLLGATETGASAAALGALCADLPAAVSAAPRAVAPKEAMFLCLSSMSLC